MKKVIRRIVLMGVALAMSVTSAVSPAGVVYAAQEQYESGAGNMNFVEFDDYTEDSFAEENYEEEEIEVTGEDTEAESPEIEYPEYEEPQDSEAPEEELPEEKPVEELSEDDIRIFEDEEAEEIELEEDSVSGNSSYKATSEDADEAEFQAEASNKCGDNATWSYNASTGALKISGTGDMYDYSEENPAPWYGKEIKSITVADGITRIGNYAFYKVVNHQKALESIYLSNTLKSIGDHAFMCTYFNSKVEKFVVPDSVTEIGKRAFSYCQLYNASTMDDKQVGGTFVLGKGVKVIPEECFWGAVAVELVLPEGLEKIEDKGMYYFQGCKKFVFPKTLKSIGEKGLGYDFSYTFVSSNITFKGDMPRFGKDCFYYRCGFVYYPAGNKTYNEKSIAAANQLTKHGFTWREEGYKSSGKAGENITWKTYNTTSGSRTYKILEFTGSGPMYDYSLTSLPDWYPERVSMDRIKFDSRITSIGDYAFFGMGNVNNWDYKNYPLVLPSNLEKIGDYAFYSVHAPLVTLPTTCSYIGNKAFAYSNTWEVTSNVFPKGVKHIGDYAFQSCSMALDVKWDKIEYIGEGAFADVKKMTFSTAFPYTLKTIGGSAFSKASTLKGQLSLPGVTKIGNGAFRDCQDITGKVELPAIESMGVGAFGGTSITELVLGDKLSAIDNKSYSYSYMGEKFKTITFKCAYFPDVRRFFEYLSYKKYDVTLNYPAGKGWPYSASEYYKSIKFVPYGKHNITFVYPDETEHTTQLSVGSKITAPKVTGLEEGVEIIGWFIEPKLEEEYEWDFNKVPMDDVKLYAFTNQAECEVVYWVPHDLEKMYDGGYSGGTERVKYGECAKYKRVARKGGRFLGWYEDKELTKPYDFSTPVKYKTRIFSKWIIADAFDFSTATDNIKYNKDLYYVYDASSHLIAPKISINYGDGFEVLEYNTDYTVEFVDRSKKGAYIDVGDYQVLVKGKGNCVGELTANIHITQLDISKAENLIPLKDYTWTYDGYEHKQSQSIRLDKENGYTLTLDSKNYNTEFVESGSKRPFVDAGTYTVRLTGINNCKGTLEYKQIIEPKSLTSITNLRKTTQITYEYNKKVQKFKPDPMLYKGGKYEPLKEGEEYTVTYEDEDVDGAYKEPGVYHIRVTGKGNYKDEYTIVEKITNNKLIAEATVSGVKNVTFTGRPAKMDKIVVKHKGKVLTEGKHYRIRYGNITEAGTGYVYIYGLEAGGFYGTKTVTFKIKPHKISKSDVEVTGLSSGKIYTGSGITADSIKIKCKLAGYKSELNGCANADYSKMYYSDSKEYDYTYEYLKNVNAGTATLVIRGVGNCTGIIKKNFKIRAAAFNEDAVSQGRIIVEPFKPVAYTKGKTVIEPEVYFKPEGGSKVLLVKGKDYTLSYSNNTKVHDENGKKAPTVKIKGKGNFKGTIARPFAIKVSSIDVCEATAKDVKYKNKVNNYRASIVVKDTNGSKLASGKDYETRYYNASTGKELTSKDKAQVGDRIKVVITGLGNYKSENTLTRYYAVVK